MKTIGMIGGTAWPSTLEYYRLVNLEVNRRLGGHHAARCLLYSFDFADIVRLKEEDPEQSGVRRLVVQTARTLVEAGAESIVLCANTLHWFAEDVERAVNVPLIHVAVATAKRIREQGFGTVGLLGTRPTMERDFYRKRLRDLGIETVVPDEAGRALVNDAIMNELVRNVLRPEVKAEFLRIIEDLRLRGAQGIVLGCTEIPLLINAGDTELPLFDTLSIHVEAAVDDALSVA